VSRGEQMWRGGESVIIDARRRLIKELVIEGVVGGRGGLGLGIRMGVKKRCV
jgi:hypothetical protein